ncbi:MAG TPA: Hsp20/alpha crystallin family protein [Streptosporangiaceae bacterium]|jgi:HSP20 family protein|nr:Hsp20/alpha crystallin family protein [Streptosporangiaceae bacterium]
MATLPARRSNRRNAPQGQNLILLDPSTEFEDIYNRMGQLMNLAFSDLGLTTSAADMPWTPMADVSETDDAYMIGVELPGVNKDDIDIQMQGSELVISGEVKDTSEGDTGRRRRSSRRMGRFEYRTYLPTDINAEGVAANLQDGVLTVTVPKSEQAKPRKIEIQG